MIRFLRTRFRRFYLGNYVHARKLFFFDIVFALSGIVIFSLTIAWRLYDPKVILGELRHFKKIVQPPVAETLTPIVRANVIVSASIGTVQTVLPGDIIPLSITIRNDDFLALEDVIVAIPVPLTIVDEARLFAISRGVIQDGNLLFTPKEREDLASILPGVALTLTLALPIADAPPSVDTDLTLVFTPRVRGRIASEVFEARGQTDAVAVGTKLSARAELRYYTEGGDQLGRGPLPPIAGKETKYGLLISAYNTTSRVAPLKISGTLSPKAVWTGKTSVSHGPGISFDSTSRQFHFDIPVLDPHDTVRIFIEVGLTPDAADIGTTPILIEEIRVDGRDAFIDRAVLKRLMPLDITIPNDTKAKLLDKTVQSE